MPRIVGIDLSTKAVELVSLDDDTGRPAWDHVHLTGSTALERLRDVPRRMPRWASAWWDDVLIAAIEAPYGGPTQAGTLAKLSRVFGAVATCIPPHVEVWEVMPKAWRLELDLPGNASKDQVARRAVELGAYRQWACQDAYDGFGLAWYARNVNTRGINAALTIRRTA